MKLSLVIPYKQRLDNLRIMFEGLAQQTMDRSEFEVVVGAMEYSPEYVAACRQFSDRIDVVSVLSAREFHIPHARNAAMRQASGEVIVQLDADTLLPPTALGNLYDRHFAAGQNVCVVGQVVGYGNNNDGDVAFVEARPYRHYRELLDELGRPGGPPRDPRFGVDPVIPWAFAWTGLAALPAATVREHGLFFDEQFRGWGVDDLEWGYRIAASGTPVVLCQDVYAIHLPHVRDAGLNRRSAQANWHRFLRKWPGPDVELAYAFGEVEANGLCRDFAAELAQVSAGHGLGVVRGTAGGKDVLVVGVILRPAAGPAPDPAVLSLFDDAARVDVLPLAGLALPYDDASAGECRVLAPVNGFSPRYREAALSEARRVARELVIASED